MSSTADLQIAIRAVDQASAVLRGVAQQTQAMGTAAKTAGPSWMAMSSAVAAGTVAAHGFMAVAQGLIGIFGKAASSSTDFGQSMANIRSLIPDADFERFGGQIQKLALQLGKEYPLSAAEAGKSMELLAQKGISAEQIVGGAAEAVVKLSSATGADLVTSTGIAAAALDTFGLGTDDLNRVVNLMVGTMTRGGISATDYGHSLQAAGAVVNLAGGTIDDLSIALAAMAKAGIEGADAGTSIKTMYSNLIPTTKEQIAVARQLGLVTADGSNAFFDASGKVKSYEEVSRILAEATSGLTQQQKLMALETLFGSDAIRAAAVAADLGAGKFGNLGEQIRSVDAGDIAAKRMDSLKMSINQFTGSAETAAIMLVSKLGPGMKTVVDTGTELLNAVIDKLDSPEAAAFFESLGQGAKQAGDDLYAAGQRASEAGESFRDIPVIGAPMNHFLQAVGSAATGLAAILRGDAKGAAAAFSSALGSLGDMLGAVATEAGPLIDMVSAAGRTIQEAAQKAGAQGAWESLFNGLENIGHAAESAGDRLDQIGATIGRVGDAAGLTADPIDVLAAMLKGAANGFEYATVQLDGFLDTILSGIDVALNYVSGLSNLGEALNALRSGDLPGVRDALEESVAAFERGNDAAEQYRQRGAERVAEAARIMADTVGIGTAQVAADSQANFDAAAVAAQVGMVGVEAATTTGMANSVAAVQAQAPVAVAAATEMGVGMTAGIEAAVPGMTAAADAGGTAVVASVQGQLGPASAAATSVGAAMTDGIASAEPGMAAAASAGASGAVSAMQAQQGAASGAGQSVGYALAEGLRSGILSAAASIANAAASLVQRALAAARNAADIESPSKVFAEKVGLPIAQGVAVGIEKGAGLVGDTLGSMLGLGSSGVIAGMGGGAAGGSSTTINHGSSITVYGDMRFVADEISRRQRQDAYLRAARRG